MHQQKKPPRKTVREINLSNYQPKLAEEYFKKAGHQRTASLIDPQVLKNISNLDKIQQINKKYCNVQPVKASSSCSTQRLNFNFQNQSAPPGEIKDDGSLKSRISNLSMHYEEFQKQQLSSYHRKSKSNEGINTCLNTRQNTISNQMNHSFYTIANEAGFQTMHNNNEISLQKDSIACSFGAQKAASRSQSKQRPQVQKCYLEDQHDQESVHLYKNQIIGTFDGSPRRIFQNINDKKLVDILTSSHSSEKKMFQDSLEPSCLRKQVFERPQIIHQFESLRPQVKEIDFSNYTKKQNKSIDLVKPRILSSSNQIVINNQNHVKNSVRPPRQKDQTILKNILMEEDTCADKNLMIKQNILKSVMCGGSSSTKIVLNIPHSIQGSSKLTSALPSKLNSRSPSMSEMDKVIFNTYNYQVTKPQKQSSTSDAATKYYTLNSYNTFQNKQDSTPHLASNHSVQQIDNRSRIIQALHMLSQMHRTNFITIIEMVKRCQETSQFVILLKNRMDFRAVYKVYQDQTLSLLHGQPNSHKTINMSEIQQAYSFEVSKFVPTDSSLGDAVTVLSRNRII